MDLEAVILQTGENLVEMVPVFLCNGAGDQNVVQVGVDKGETTEDLVHKSLEGLGCIPQAKGHLQELKKSKGGGDGGLRNVLRCDRDLVVGSNQINLGKDGAAM